MSVSELETFGKSLSLEIATDSHTSLACQTFSIRDNVKENRSQWCPLPCWMPVQHLPPLFVMINLVEDGKLYTWNLYYLQTWAGAIWPRLTLYQPELSLLYNRWHWGTENLSHFPSHTVKTYSKLDQNSDFGRGFDFCVLSIVTLFQRDKCHCAKQHGWTRIPAHKFWSPTPCISHLKTSTLFVKEASR